MINTDQYFLNMLTQISLYFLRLILISQSEYTMLCVRCSNAAAVKQAWCILERLKEAQRTQIKQNMLDKSRTSLILEDSPPPLSLCGPEASGTQSSWNAAELNAKNAISVCSAMRSLLSLTAQNAKENSAHKLTKGQHMAKRSVARERQWPQTCRWAPRQAWTLLRVSTQSNIVMPHGSLLFNQADKQWSV